MAYNLGSWFASGSLQRRQSQPARCTKGQSQSMVGLPASCTVTTLLIGIEDDFDDPAFAHSTKPIDPVVTA